MATTGEVIKILRKRNNLKQSDLADILGVKLSTIQKYENGMVQNLKLDVIRKICVYFNVPPYFLIYPENFSEKQPDVYTQYIFSKALNMNDQGRKRLVEYVEDISLIPKYQKQDNIIEFHL